MEVSGGFSTRECGEKQSRDEFLTVVNILEAFMRNTPPQSTHSCHSATHCLGVSGQLCRHQVCPVLTFRAGLSDGGLCTEVFGAYIQSSLVTPAK